MAELPEINIDECGKCYEFCVDDHPFKIEIISSTEDYIRVLKGVFDFERIAALFKRADFHFYFDAINGGILLSIGSRVVSSAYAKPIFVDLLGAKESCLHNCISKPVLVYRWHDDVGLWWLPSGPQLDLCEGIGTCNGLGPNGSAD